MNEEAFQIAYDYFVDNGYTKSKDQFKVLLKDNSTAFDHAYDYFVDNGYGKDKGQFSSLIGIGEIIEEPLKKKESENVITESLSEDGSLVQEESKTELPIKPIDATSITQEVVGTALPESEAPRMPTEQEWSQYQETQNTKAEITDLEENKISEKYGGDTIVFDEVEERSRQERIDKGLDPTTEQEKERLGRILNNKLTKKLGVTEEEISDKLYNMPDSKETIRRVFQEGIIEPFTGDSGFQGIAYDTDLTREELREQLTKELLSETESMGVMGLSYNQIESIVNSKIDELDLKQVKDNAEDYKYSSIQSKSNVLKSVGLDADSAEKEALKAYGEDKLKYSIDKLSNETEDYAAAISEYYQLRDKITKSKGDISPEDKQRLFTLTQTITDLRGNPTQLIDPETGLRNIKDEEKRDTYIGTYNEEATKVKELPFETLKRIHGDAYDALQSLRNSDRYKNISNMGSLEYGSAVIKEKNRLENQEVKLRARFDAMNRALLLNENLLAEDNQGGFFSAFGETLAETLASKVSPVGIDIQSDRDLRREFANQVMKDGNVRLSKEEIENIDNNFSESIGDGVAIVADMAIELATTKKVLGSLGAVKRLGAVDKAVYNSLKAKKGLVAANAYRVASAGVKEGMLYQLTPNQLLSAEMGFAEGATQEALSLLNVSALADKLGGKYGKLLEFGIRTAAGGTSEVMAEYAGDYVDSLNKNNFDTSKALGDTFGRTGDEVLDKLLITTILSFGMSGAGNAKVGLNGVRALVDKGYSKEKAQQLIDEGVKSGVLNDVTKEDISILEQETGLTISKPKATEVQGTKPTKELVDQVEELEMLNKEVEELENTLGFKPDVEEVVSEEQVTVNKSDIPERVTLEFDSKEEIPQDLLDAESTSGIGETTIGRGRKARTIFTVNVNKSEAESLGLLKTDEKVSDVQDAKIIEETLNEQATEQVTEQATEQVTEQVEETKPTLLTEYEGKRVKTKLGDTEITGTVVKDGGALIIEQDNGNILELGNYESLSNEPSTQFELELEKPVVEMQKGGSIIINNKKYSPRVLDNPLESVNYDNEGNIVSVTLNTDKGESRTFRGQNAQEVSYALHLQELNKRKGGPKVDFRLKTEASEEVTFDEQEADRITAEMNLMETPNTDVSVEATESERADTIDISELNQRTDTDFEAVDMKTTEGLPHLFTISDQLTTGDVVNPQTGNSIDNLRGAVGFNATEGNNNSAWANIKKKHAINQHKKAKALYDANKEVFEKWWAANPKYDGLVPMAVVQMGESSIKSNEAVFRVLQDNLTKIPKKNKVAALKYLKKLVDDKLNKWEGDKTNEFNELTKIQSLIKTTKAKSIEEILTPDAVNTLKALPARARLITLVTSGNPIQAKGKSKKVSTGGLRGVSKVLAEGVDPNLVHLQTITQLLTDPQLKNVPIGNIVSLVGIDVKSDNQGAKKVVHPNYEWGTEGRSIGVLEQPVPMETVFPKAFEKIIKKFIEKAKKTRSEKAFTKEGKNKAISSSRTEQLGVGIGIPSGDYVGAIADASPSNLNKLVTFLNLAFPNTVINTDTTTFINVISSEGVKKYLKGDEVIYGVTVNGDVYINPEVHNSESNLYNTAIHEVGHVWTDYLQTTKKGKQIYSKGSELVKQTEEFKRQLELFDGDVDAAVNETMAILIGNKGETITNASINSKFKEWLVGMWEYIRQTFKMSKDITTEEIQDMSLDEFLGTALADIFSGSEIKMTDAQLKKLKNPEAVFSKGMSISNIVKTAREQGFSDSSIKVVLKKRGFKSDAIKEAMKVQIDLVTQLPREFADIEGGAKVGQTLFNEVRDEINAFAIEDSEGKLVEEITKSFAEIRDKAQEILTKNPIYQAQTEQVQLELQNALDRSIGIRAGVNVSKQISDVRKKLKQRKIGAKNLKDAQYEMRIAIRKMLPKSDNYLITDINKLIKVINETNEKNFDGQLTFVLDTIEKQRQKAKIQLINKIQDLVEKKAKVKITSSSKRRSAGLDSIGQAYFNEVKKVLRLVKENDIEGINELQESVSPSKLSEIEQKIKDGDKLTSREQVLIDRQLALDTFADVVSMQLEEVEVLFKDVKATRAESIARLNNRRELRRKSIEKAQEALDSQIRVDFPELYNESGNPLGVQALKQKREEIRAALKSKGVFKAINVFINKFKNEGLKYTTTSLGNFFRNNFTHLGTMTNILDRGKKGVFTKLFYDNINDMDEKHLKGIRRVENRLNDIAQSATGKDWTKWKYSLGTDILELDNIIETKEETIMKKFPINMDQALRIYALSLNNIQNNKLVEQGITRENLNKIKSFIGKDNLEVVDQVVDFLSNEYFEEVNNVFSQANDVNLGYINNYFPTKTISQAAINKEMLQSDDFSGIFTAEYAPALKERTDRKSDILLGFSFTEAMEEHVQQIEKYKAYALGVKEMNEVLKHQPTQNVLKETGMMQVFKKSLNYAINPDSGPALSNDVVSKVQRLFTGFALAFKPIQIIKQATSFIQAYDTYNSGINVKGKQVLGLDLLSFVADYAYVLGNIVNEIKESREISAGFDSRIKAGLKGEIFGLESGGRTFKSTKARQDTVGKLARGFKRAAGLPTVVGDILGVLGYKAVYNADIRNGMSKDKALRKFNDYNATQQSKRATEKVGIQQSTNEFTRAFTMFGSTVLLQQNKIIQSMNSILTDIGNKKVPKSKDIKTLALNYSIANVLFTAAAYSMNFINGNDEDKDRAWKAIKDAALGKTLIYQIPFLGSALEEWENWASDSRRPTGDVVNPLSSVSRKIRRSIESSQKSGELIKTIQPLAEILIGAQVDAPLALAKLLGTGDVSEENIYDLLGVSRSYRPGYGNNKNNNTSRKKTSKKNIRLIDPDLYEELYGGESSKSEIDKEIRDQLKK